MRLLFIILALAFVSPVYALEKDPYPFSSVNDAERFYALNKEIRCVVCQNQNIADSTAPLANDLRGKIYQFIKEKKSDEEIKTYLVKRYGEFILLRPRFNKLTILLWLFPLLAFMSIGLILIRFIRQQNIKT